MTPPFAESFRDPVADCAIEDYGVIGDCRTVALVSRYGSIDWWCSPEFSSPSCFSSLLDRERGGRFAITPRDCGSVEQCYLPETNVLQTRFTCTQGTLELTDFMSVPEARGADGVDHLPQEIFRIARCTAGQVELQVLLQPRPDYARAAVQLVPQAEGCWRCSAPGFELNLSTNCTLRADEHGALGSVVAMQAGDCHFFQLEAAATAGCAPHALGPLVEQRQADTAAWWQQWCSQCTYDGDYREAVIRSALTLKLLTHRPTGAVVAAATTSLPESFEAARNWDYRYCWLRDTSLVLHAFTDLGYAGESRAFQEWLLHATRETRPRLQVMYDVHGKSRLDEVVLPHLRGFHGVGPVRIGNAASQQVQHDAYGEVILTTSDELDMGGTLDEHEKALLAEFTQMVMEIWREPDHGIWEIRLPPRHNTHSKLMCWAALDRAVRMHHEHGLPIDPEQVGRERDAIRADIEAHGYSEAVHSYVGYYGSDAPDASVLLMPRLGYVEPNAPRMRSTVDFLMERLHVNGLMYRYQPGPHYDGVQGPEHLFAICSFWLVDCLARQGRVDEATRMYERLLELRNHLGLFAEEYRVEDGKPMGNFPQAFSHVGAITAALSLMRVRRFGKVDAFW